MTFAELTFAFNNVHSVWPGKWPGIPLLFDSCVRYLGGVSNQIPRNSRIKALQKCANRIAGMLEIVGANAEHTGVEPAYHNRLHTGLALVSLTALLDSNRKQVQHPPNSLTETEYLLLLTMLSHDYGHPGGRNNFPAELEQKTLELITPVMKSSGLSKSDQKRIGEIILQTDPVSVSAAHAKAKKLAFDINKFEWQCVLIQEADVLASALPEIGKFLTECLAQEWSCFDVELASGLLSPEGREGFLQHGALFSSPASNALGIPEVVSRQLAALRSDKAVANST
jgi:hypothetical protein